MKITFVRHGETDWNASGRTTGRLDVPLNAEGKRQADAIAAELLPVYDCLYSSKLARARETAEVISAKLRLPITFYEHIYERDFGSLAGKTWNEITDIVGPDARAADREQRYDYRPFGGESAADVRARILRFIEEVKESGCRNPLIVAHGGVMRMMHRIHGREVGHIDNASAHEFEL